MSPLTDITNAGELERIVKNQHMFSQSKARVWLSKSCPRIPSVHIQDQLNTPQSYSTIKRKSEPVAIKKCNIPISHQKYDNKPNEDITENYHCSNTRNQNDPPLVTQVTDILLSDAVQTLSLSQTSAQSRLKVHNHKVKHKILLEKTPDLKHKVKTDVVTSSSGLPETPPSTCERIVSRQQCDACGLEFTSLSVFTQHLAQHVYDGLYAARWLTQAMYLLRSRPETQGGRSSNDNGNGVSDVQNCFLE